MNCRDFDQTWNRLLDAESGPRRDDGPGAAAGRLAREAELLGHADSCPSCLLRHRQFESLRVAIRAWSGRPRVAPAVSTAAAERIVRDALAAPEPAPGPVPAGRRGATRPLAWAAGLAAAALAAAFLRPVAPERPRPEPARPVSLSVAVADAREASWRLAWTASEPAARLGLAMLDASLAGDAASDGTAPPPDEEAAPGPGAPGLVDRVGGYAAAGARPLSDAARRAFGFLRPPSLDKAAPAASPRGT